MKKKKKKKYSNAGKGDKSRVSDKERYDKNWERDSSQFQFWMG